MDHGSTSWFDVLVLWATVFLTWAVGEGGRVVIAGAAGGLMRWIMDEKRRIRDGAVAIIAGAIFAKYFTPVGLVLLDKWFGPLTSDIDQIRDSAAFAMGIGGMTVGKLIMAMFEKYSEKMK